MKTHLYIAGIRITFAVERHTQAYEDFIVLFNMDIKPLLYQKTETIPRIPKSDEEIKARMLYDMAHVMMTVGFNPETLNLMFEDLSELFKTHEYITALFRRVEDNIDKYTDFVHTEPITVIEEQIANSTWIQPEESPKIISQIIEKLMTRMKSKREQVPAEQPQVKPEDEET